MRGDIFYEVKYLIHCIMYKGIGIEFCWVLSHCGLYWNEILDKTTAPPVLLLLFLFCFVCLFVCFCCHFGLLFVLLPLTF